MDKIRTTTDYSQFRIAKENRDIDLSKPESKWLRQSIKKYGWLSSFPIMCRKNGSGLVIIDGQHRFTIAKELGVPVKYVIDETNIDVSDVNRAQRKWGIKDYLNRWLKEGKPHYYEIVDLKETYPNVPIGMCIGLLAGTSSWSNVRNQFESGNYKVKSKGLAYKICGLYQLIIETNNDAKSTNFLKALYACFYVDDFDPKRLLESCKKRPHLIQSYSKIEDFLEMIEEIYNYSYKTGRIPLKFQAQEAMRKRNPIKT